MILAPEECLYLQVLVETGPPYGFEFPTGLIHVDVDHRGHLGVGLPRQKSIDRSRMRAVVAAAIWPAAICCTSRSTHAPAMAIDTASLCRWLSQRRPRTGQAIHRSPTCSGATSTAYRTGTRTSLRPVTPALPALANNAEASENITRATAIRSRRPAGGEAGHASPRPRLQPPTARHPRYARERRGQRRESKAGPGR